MSVGAVYDRAPFLESTKYARSQTAPTANAPLFGPAPREASREGIFAGTATLCAKPAEPRESKGGGPIRARLVSAVPRVTTTCISRTAAA
jgi:hypothetical protein